MHFVLHDIAGPVLDGADGRHLVAHLQKRVARIALPGRQRILEHDQRQARRVGDAPEMLDRHRGRLPERERRRRKYQQRRRAAVFRHAGDARGLQTAVGPDAVDDRQLAADLILRDGEYPALLVEGTGGDLRRMSVDRDGGEALDRRDILQVLAETLLVDRQVVVERQDDGRNDAMRHEMGMTRHFLALLPTAGWGLSAARPISRQRYPLLRPLT